MKLDDEWLDNLFDHAATLPKLIIMGDLNARNIVFGDTIKNSKGNALVRMLNTSNLFRLENLNFTFIGFNGSFIIDHILKLDDLIPHFPDHLFIRTCVTSDHVPLLVQTDLQTGKHNSSVKRKISQDFGILLQVW